MLDFRTLRPDTRLRSPTGELWIFRRCEHEISGVGTATVFVVLHGGSHARGWMRIREDLAGNLILADEVEARQATPRPVFLEKLKAADEIKNLHERILAHQAGAAKALDRIKSLREGAAAENRHPPYEAGQVYQHNSGGLYLLTVDLETAGNTRRLISLTTKADAGGTYSFGDFVGQAERFTYVGSFDKVFEYTGPVI